MKHELTFAWIGGSTCATDHMKKTFKDHGIPYRYNQYFTLEAALPKELAKIDNASISTYGRYVVYDILDDADKDAAYRVIEDMLISESYKRTLQGGSFLYESPQPCHTNRIKNIGGVW